MSQPRSSRPPWRWRDCNRGLYDQGDTDRAGENRSRRFCGCHAEFGALDDDRRPAGLYRSRGQWRSAARRVCGQRRRAAGSHAGSRAGGSHRVRSEQWWPINGAASFDGTLQTDQWTVSGGLNDHRPLLRYVLNDAEGTVFYVSSTTGEVVRDTHSPGARAQLLRRRHALDLSNLHSPVSGVVGMDRRHPFRRGRRAGDRRTVDRHPALESTRSAGQTSGAVPRAHALALFHRHHFRRRDGHLGLQWPAVDEPVEPESAAPCAGGSAVGFTGKPFTVDDFELPAQGSACSPSTPNSFTTSASPFIASRTRIRACGSWVGNASAAVRLAGCGIDARARSQTHSGRAVAEATVLTAWDNYYYTAASERGERALPVIRVRFEDEQHSWFHLDPLTGQIVDRSTRTNRVYRWLYNGLHSFDIWWLWQRRPLWDICVITFSLGGVLLSMIGVVIGWRRLRTSRCAARSCASRRIRAIRHTNGTDASLTIRADFIGTPGALSAFLKPERTMIAARRMAFARRSACARAYAAVSH